MKAIVAAHLPTAALLCVLTALPVNAGAGQQASPMRPRIGVAFGGALALGALSFMTAVGWAGATF